MTTATARVWHATISPSSTITTGRPRGSILHLHDIPTMGEARRRLAGPAEVRAFLADHPEVEAVNVYDNRFPRRPVPVGRFDGMIAKLFA